MRSQIKEFSDNGSKNDVLIYLKRAHMSSTWAEVIRIGHEQSLHEQDINGTHMSRTWRQFALAETHKQNSHALDMSWAWTEFIQAGHEHKPHEQDMSRIHMSRIWVWAGYEQKHISRTWAEIYHEQDMNRTPMNKIWTGHKQLT